MFYVRPLILAAAFSVAGWSTCQAAGSYQRPEPRAVVQAGMPSVPLPSISHVTAGDLVGGCGRGRVRDPQTHACHGPADIR
jgi:hypothetical protein